MVLGIKPGSSCTVVEHHNAQIDKSYDIIFFLKTPKVGIIGIFVSLQMEINLKYLPTKWIWIQI